MVTSNWSCITKSTKERRCRDVTGKIAIDSLEVRKNYGTTFGANTREKGLTSVINVEKHLHRRNISKIMEFSTQVVIVFLSTSFSSFFPDMRPFSCEWDGCGIGFRRKHHLTAHQRVHTKERPFACHFPGCDMKFTKTHHVKRHYETHFKNTAYKMYQAELSGVQMQVTTGTQQPSSVSPPVPLPNTSSISSFTFL